MPEKAGVMYTVSPRPDGNESCYIEANYGTGDSVVGGRASPDGYECSRRTGEVTFHHIGRKSVMSKILEGGGTADVPVPDSLRLEPVLGTEEILGLVGLGRAVEGAFGLPQDIEWAIDDTGTWLLQSRPITGRRGEDTKA
jgi:pyruvate,water dikinase